MLTLSLRRATSGWEGGWSARQRNDKLSSMNPRKLLSLAILLCAFRGAAPAAETEQHLLYVANPGTRNYVEYGGIGISVFDIDNGYKFVRRIPTWSVPEGAK